MRVAVNWFPRNASNYIVMAALVAAIPLRGAMCPPKRDRRVNPRDRLERSLARHEQRRHVHPTRGGSSRQGYTLRIWLLKNEPLLPAARRPAAAASGTCSYT